MMDVNGLSKATMVIGMDIYHDNINKNDSYMGFTASIHPKFTSYYNTVKK